MAEKKLLLGDEAIALGATYMPAYRVYMPIRVHRPLKSQSLSRIILWQRKKMHSTWCTNEKTAMEAALGMSYAGKRALVCMKHVGMNVAADAFRQFCHNRRERWSGGAGCR